MANFEVYAKKGFSNEVVKQGWSWPALFFQWMWGYYKGLSSQATVGLIVNIIIGVIYIFLQIKQASISPYSHNNQSDLILLSVLSLMITIASIAIAIVFGSNGNRWYREYLVKNNYKLVGEISASDYLQAQKLSEENSFNEINIQPDSVDNVSTNISRAPKSLKYSMLGLNNVIGIAKYSIISVLVLYLYNQGIKDSVIFSFYSKSFIVSLYSSAISGVIISLFLRSSTAIIIGLALSIIGLLVLLAGIYMTGVALIFCGMSITTISIIYIYNKLLTDHSISEKIIFNLIFFSSFGISSFLGMMLSSLTNSLGIYTVFIIALVLLVCCLIFYSYLSSLLYKSDFMAAINPIIQNGFWGHGIILALALVMSCIVNFYSVPDVIYIVLIMIAVAIFLVFSWVNPYSKDSQLNRFNPMSSIFIIFIFGTIYISFCLFSIQPNVIVKLFEINYSEVNMVMMLSNIVPSTIVFLVSVLWLVLIKREVEPYIQIIGLFTLCIIATLCALTYSFSGYLVASMIYELIRVSLFAVCLSLLLAYSNRYNYGLMCAVIVSLSSIANALTIMVSDFQALLYCTPFIVIGLVLTFIFRSKISQKLIN